MQFHPIHGKVQLLGPDLSQLLDRPGNLAVEVVMRGIGTEGVGNALVGCIVETLHPFCHSLAVQFTGHNHRHADQHNPRCRHHVMRQYVCEAASDLSDVGAGLHQLLGRTV
jgi:hypothetical protein